jgi:hypothetical protein
MLVAALERGGERTMSVEGNGEHRGGTVALEHVRGGERRGGVIALEHTRDGERPRWCRREGRLVNEEELTDSRANKIGACGYVSGELGCWVGVMAHQ